MNKIYKITIDSLCRKSTFFMNGIAVYNIFKTNKANKNTMQLSTDVFLRTHPSLKTSLDAHPSLATKDPQITGFNNSSLKLESVSKQLNFNNSPRTLKKCSPNPIPRTQNQARHSLKPHHQFQVTLSTFFCNLRPQIKIQWFTTIIKRYRELIKKYGMFLLTQEQIKFNNAGELHIYINPISKINQPSWPLPNSRQGQVAAVAGFLELVKKHLSDRVYKFAKVQSLEELVLFVDKMQKRNSIHKKCQTIAKMRSESKNKNAKELGQCESPKFSQVGTRLKRFASSQVLKIQIKKPNEAKQILQENSQSKYLLPTSQSMTNFSTNIVSKRGSICGDSHLTKQKKSCTIEQNKENYFSKFPVENSIKNSQFLNNREYEQELCKTLNIDFFPSNRKGHAAAKSSLEVSFNKLFLSDINEDPESDMQTSNGKTQSLQQQLLREFSNVFY